MPVNPIPPGYHNVTPYLIVEGAARVIDFAKQAFGAEEIMRMDGKDGAIGHAEFKIGDSRVMVADSSDRWPSMPVSLHLYVEDCDSLYARAMEAGGTSLREPVDEFYGDRSAGVKDPAGNLWWLATHVEDVPEDEMARRAKEWVAQQS